jgi:histidinol phosphatase-like enzyme (inositol monophosphatase family)
MSDSALLMEAVTQAARVAGEVALRSFGARPDIETKPDGSPVTIADRASEAAARAWIGHRFPGDDIVGEELPADRHGGRRRWIIDPIDGTRTFVRGVPLWGTLIAVAEGDDVLAGAAFFPALDEMLCAATGEGAWWNGVRCSVSNVAKLSDATVLTTDERFAATPERRHGWERLSSGAALSRSWGDCYGYLLVATGRAEVMLDPQLSDWDAAALLPAIREAGGVFTDWDGNPTAFGGSAIATNRALAATARARLCGTAARAAGEDR